MRLLERIAAGQYKPTEDFIDDAAIPPYAILSHTWTHGQEVTFQDFKNGTHKDKTGFQKIQFCGEQADKHGLRYFWVDTCNIDRSNSVELHEAINSMFRWYQNAARCYVYLSDVSFLKRKAENPSSDETSGWESSFKASRWHYRGWTLQEMLAPKSVEFFSREGERLGDKQSLQAKINEVTGIPISALQGARLSQFSVQERFGWMDSRTCTRKEDEAYSLLGIFDIHLPLIYGEGRNHALRRLKNEVSKMTSGQFGTLT